MAEAMRLDLFLWHARLARTRAFAQGLAAHGRVRIDGRLVDKPSAPVRPGNVLTFADHRGAVHAVRIEALPARRGPPAEARGCYSDLTNANVSQQTHPIDVPGDRA